MLHGLAHSPVILAASLEKHVVQGVSHRVDRVPHKVHELLLLVASLAGYFLPRLVRASDVALVLLKAMYRYDYLSLATKRN